MGMTPPLLGQQEIIEDIIRVRENGLAFNAAELREQILREVDLRLAEATRLVANAMENQFAARLKAEILREVRKIVANNAKAIVDAIAQVVVKERINPTVNKLKALERDLSAATLDRELVRNEVLNARRRPRNRKLVIEHDDGTKSTVVEVDEVLNNKEVDGVLPHRQSS
jgi:hypothetical protein